MKVAIIGGAGRVGSATAYALLAAGIDELILSDVDKRVLGEALDLQVAFPRASVKGTTNNKDCNGSDIIIIVAGVSLGSAGTLDRNALTEQNAKIMTQLLGGIEDDGKAVYIVVTNPVDAMAFLVNEKIRDRTRVLGVSTITDSARMEPPAQGYLIGEHAGIMVPVGSGIDPGEVIKRGSDVVAAKGGTWFTTATVILEIVRSITEDKKKQLPISVLLEGEYGLRDVCLSVPCIVCRKGIERIVEVDLEGEQSQVMKSAAASVRGCIARAKNAAVSATM
jgi:malate/lactate dehydrogenase